MAELATIARPYAQAYFQAMQGEDASAMVWLEEAAAFAQAPELLALASDPRIQDEQVLSLVRGAMQTQASDKASNFLQAVIENGRLSALPTIAQQVRSMFNAQQGVNDAVVYSAYELDDAALQNLKLVLEQRFGRTLKLTVALAPELIGGVRVVVGDEVFDTSVKARLEQMKSTLMA
jgi:F-type H+-transporting ATPase subunit delta